MNLTLRKKKIGNPLRVTFRKYFSTQPPKPSAAWAVESIILKPGYFCLNPNGQTGLMAVTFLVTLPFTQVIVRFTGFDGVVVVVVGAGGTVVGDV